MNIPEGGGPAGVGPRFPIRAHTDGDFALIDLLAAEPAEPATSHRMAVAAPRDGVAEAAATARPWNLTTLKATTAALATGPWSTPPTGTLPRRTAALTGQPVRQADLTVLHSFETTPVLRPPVADHTAALTPAIARAWLTLAEHWIGLAAASSDLRFFNTACKLLGAVAVHPTAAPVLTEQITTVAHLVRTATTQLHDHLAGRLSPCALPAAEEKPERLVWTCQGNGHGAPPRPRAHEQPRLLVLAGAGSGSPARLAAATSTAGVRLTAVCWYEPPAPQTPPSGYDTAWYPPEQPTVALRSKLAPMGIPQTRARDWEQVARACEDCRADLVILVGMPIVPAAVLERTRLGAINAHNGALPTYRGMDAVAWAILNNDPVICTLHRVEPGVDTGDVLASMGVPLTPLATLRARVKNAQIAMLAAAAIHLASTGNLPAATAQTIGLGRQFYRLHPHLKRILDHSPYGAPPAPPHTHAAPSLTPGTPPTWSPGPRGAGAAP